MMRPSATAHVRVPVANIHMSGGKNEGLIDFVLNRTARNIFTEDNFQAVKEDPTAVPDYYKQWQPKAKDWDGGKAQEVYSNRDAIMKEINTVDPERKKWTRANEGGRGYGLIDGIGSGFRSP